MAASPPVQREGRSHLASLYLSVYNLTSALLWGSLLQRAVALLWPAFFVGAISIWDWNKGSIVFAHIWSTCMPLLLVTQTMALLDVLHAVLGLSGSSVRPALMQVIGRNLVLFLIHTVNPDVQHLGVSVVMLLVWSLVEIIRFPYYLLAVWSINFPPLTLLRYSIWIVLYPIGMASESYIQFLSMPAVKTNRFGVVNGLEVFYYFQWAWFLITLASYPSMLLHMAAQSKKALMPSRSIPAKDKPRRKAD